MRRVSTPLRRFLQGWRTYISPAAVLSVLAVLCFASPTTADDGEPLGARIAERLCYPDSVDSITLSERDAATYRDSFTLSGDYRDIQGAEARADFTKKGPIAECRKPATATQPLLFCAKVMASGDRLIKGRPRLCF
jgi:hypothetical protein